MERTWWVDQVYSEIIQGQKAEGVVDAADHPTHAGSLFLGPLLHKNLWNLLLRSRNIP